MTADIAITIGIVLAALAWAAYVLFFGDAATRDKRRYTNLLNDSLARYEEDGDGPAFKERTVALFLLTHLTKQQDRDLRASLGL